MYRHVQSGLGTHLLLKSSGLLWETCLGEVFHHIHDRPLHWVTRFLFAPRTAPEWRTTVTMTQLIVQHSRANPKSLMLQLTDSQMVSHQPQVELVFLGAKAQEMENLEQPQHKLGKEKQLAVSRLGYTAGCSALPDRPRGVLT